MWPSRPNKPMARILTANGTYLFFTETGGYVWRLDPLAQKRGVPTAELRGSRRAS